MEKLQNIQDIGPSGNEFSVVDKRSWAQEPGTQGDVGEETSAERHRHPTYVEELLSKLEEKDRRLKEFIASHQEETKKENEAFRNRLNREMERRLEAAKVDLIRGFLEVLDNLDRALNSGFNHQDSLEELLKGIEIIKEQLNSQIKTQGIEKLDRCGRIFDPHLDEALEVVAVEENQDNIVLEEIEAGYILGEKLIRPAKVKVGRFEGAQVRKSMGPS